MKVYELVALLAQYDDDAEVEVFGGGSDFGAWAQLRVDGKRLVEWEESYDEDFDEDAYFAELEREA